MAMHQMLTDQRIGGAVPAVRMAVAVSMIVVSVRCATTMVMAVRVSDVIWGMPVRNGYTG